MKPSKRRNGFYFVKYAGEWVVAEWIYDEWFTCGDIKKDGTSPCEQDFEKIYEVPISFKDHRKRTMGFVTINIKDADYLSKA